MKPGILFSIGLALVLSGCKSNTTTAPSADPSHPEKVRELTVKSPGDQSIKLNGTDEMSISISRKNFDSPVAIELRDLPVGVEVVTPDTTIPPGKTSLNLTLRAKPGTKEVTGHKVVVAAVPKGEKDLPEVATDFKLTIKPKD
jgi:ABC-type Fe3+-hydroxamate transport system substrate-binding protein